MSVELKQTDVAAVKSLLGDLKGKYKTVMTTSINKALTTARTQATARIGNELNLKAARIKQDFSIKKANFGDISGSLKATGEPVGLVQFGAKSVNKGVSVKVLRASSRSLVKHAYIASRGSKEHVYWRKNRVAGTGKWPVGQKTRAPWKLIPARYRVPVERLTGPRIEDIFASSRVLDPVSIQAQHVYLQNVDAKITDILRRHSG